MDDYVPATPITGIKMGIGASRRLSMTPGGTGQRRASMSTATTQMMPTPKKATTKMIRRASVATGLGVDSLTPKLSRRASVSSGIGNEQSISKARVRIRQQRKGATPIVKGPVDEENVRRLIKEHLAKEKLNKEAAPSGKGPVDEDNVRRMIKEHLVKEKLKKKKEQKEKEEEEQHEEEDEDESNRSDSDDETNHSCDDDTSVSSCSSASSASSSRWEDDAIYGDNAPRLLARHDSCDGDTLLDWTPDQAAEVLRDRRAVRRPTKESNGKNYGKGERKAESEEERKARKKAKKAAKTKKEKKEKKVKKVKKDKKRASKSKLKSKDEDQDGDKHSVESGAENTMIFSASSSQGSGASFFEDSDLEEVKPTKKKKEKKTK